MKGFAFLEEGPVELIRLGIKSVEAPLDEGSMRTALQEVYLTANPPSPNPHFLALPSHHSRTGEPGSMSSS